MHVNYLHQNIAAIKQTLPDTITLIVVSKNQPGEKIVPLLENGHREFGENRIQEVKGKWRELKKHYPQSRLHFIGHLQTNKVKDAVALCDAIHTVDRVSLANALAGEMRRTGKYPDCFIQVNTGDEEQKSGVAVEEADKFIAYCCNELLLPVKGLMCIPPVHDDPAKHFQLLQNMASRTGLTLLSMGMTNDYGVALKYGATHIRIGRAIFEEKA
jgi:PLP dependent protein